MEHSYIADNFLTVIDDSMKDNTLWLRHSFGNNRYIIIFNGLLSIWNTNNIGNLTCYGCLGKDEITNGISGNNLFYRGEYFNMSNCEFEMLDEQHIEKIQIKAVKERICRMDAGINDLDSSFYKTKKSNKLLKRFNIYIENPKYLAMVEKLKTENLSRNGLFTHLLDEYLIA